MEYEQSVEKPTIKQLLGSEHEAGQEPGIIKEYEGHIQRRAYDYLMVGFATDSDQIEDQREARFEAYLDKIELDFSMYHSDVAQWNQDHQLNSRLDTSQMQLKEGKIIRREDLPSEETCKQAIITSSIAHELPRREQIRIISQEGIEKFFDQALDDSYGLLQSRLDAIALDVRTAPLTHVGDRPKTFNELVTEREVLNQRKAVLKSRIDGIPSELLNAPYVRNESNVATRDELLIEHRDAVLAYPKVIARLGRIEKELPNARLDPVMTRDELADEYATIVARMKTLEGVYEERKAQKNNLLPGIEDSHTLMDELRPVTGKLAVIGNKVLQLTGIRAE